MKNSKKSIIKALETIIETQAGTADKVQKVLMVGAEVAPYATVGGFSYVLSYLSKELVRLGHDVRLFMPRFGFIDQEKYNIEMVYEGLKVPTDNIEIPYLICNVKSAVSPSGVTVYFLENNEYYEKRANVYSYSDDSIRWALLSRGALEFIKTGIFVPDVIHSNDWHTGIVSNYLKTSYAKEPLLSDIATVFTIHNLSIQGYMLDHNNVSELDFDDGRSAIADFLATG